MVTKVYCPICGESVTWEAQSLFKPFCSERCKQIDLGGWATGAYSIPVAEESTLDNKEDNKDLL